MCSSDLNFPLPQLAPGERLALTCSVEVLEDFVLDSARLAARAVGAGIPGDTAVVVGAFALHPNRNAHDRKTPEHMMYETLYEGADARIILKEYQGPKRNPRKSGR